MNRFLLVALLAFAACSGDSTSTTATNAVDQAATHPTAVAFLNVHVVPMDAERVLDDQTVVVRDGRIETVGPAAETEVPDDAMRIDAAGQYLLPGLAEMHGHVPPPSAPAQYLDDVLFLYVANGITTVRGMLGHEGQLALRDSTNGSDAWAPTLYLAGPSFNGQSVESPEQAEQMVRRQVEEGWNLLKVHPGLTREEYDAMANTANELGMRFGGHVPEDVGLAHALAMNQETFDHLDGYIAFMNGDAGPVTDEQLEEVVRMTNEAGAWVVPTMVLWETLYGMADLETLSNLPELRYMPPRQVRQWIETHEQRLANPARDPEAARQRILNRMRLLEAMNEGGVKILMGTDAPQQFSVPGFSLHRELRRMAETGMSPYEILVTGTRLVGEYFANEDTFGTIAPGQRADLILLNSNPLEDVTRVADRGGVMLRGHWIPEEDIQERLERIATSYADAGGG